MKQFFCTLLNKWNKFEIVLLLSGIVCVTVVTIAIKGEIINYLYTILIFISALLMAKGKYFAFIFGILGILLYAFLSYNAKYYGEVFISLFIMLPLSIYGLLSWQRNQKNTIVEIKKISPTQLILLILLQLILFPLYYQLLQWFNTENLFVSALSFDIHLVSFNLMIRRSEYCFIGFALCDFILLILWMPQLLAGNLMVITILMGPLLLFINDIYGIYNWKRMIFKQKI